MVFFLHGNSANLKEWFTDGSPYRRANVDLVMMDYRGFGKSTGRIESEAQLHADVEAVWQSVALRYAGKRVNRLRPFFWAPGWPPHGPRATSRT